MVVAEGAGDGRAAGEVLGDEGLDDVGLEALLLVDEVVRDAELLGDAAGVVDVVDGAAAALHGLGHAFVAGEAALVPELQGEADEGVALLAQESGDGRGVDAAGHGDGDGFGLCGVGHACPPPSPPLLRKIFDSGTLGPDLDGADAWREQPEDAGLLLLTHPLF